VSLSYLGDVDNLEDAGEGAQVYERDDLRRGDVIEGPAIIMEKLSTTHVCTGQRATVGRYGEIVIRKGEKA
jgi:N-methylhydantoinase A